MRREKKMFYGRSEPAWVGEPPRAREERYEIISGLVHSCGPMILRWTLPLASMM